MFLGLREILQNYAYCDVVKLRNAGLSIVRSQADKMVLSRIRGTVEKGLRHLFITSSSSHFFQESNFEQYLFKEKTTKINSSVFRGCGLKDVFNRTRECMNENNLIMPLLF